MARTDEAASMSTHAVRCQLLVMALLAATVLVGCGGGGGGGGGSDDSGGPTTPPSGVDRSGTWTLLVMPADPCAGDPASFTIAAELVQDDQRLEGEGCEGGNPATVSLALSGANNEHFTGSLNVCESVNANCQAPFVAFSCVRISIQGDIDGSNVTGTYSAGVPACNASGTFTGTIS